MNMRDSKKLILVFSGITIIVFSVLFLTIFSLYKLALHEHENQLVDIVNNQKLLIESMHQFNSTHNQKVSGGAIGATLRQIKEAHQRFKGLGETGEFTLAEKQDNQMVFLLSHRHYDKENPNPVPINSKTAEPMRRALSGKSGIIVGLDYRNEWVLAAHEPLMIPHWGIVAKIDVSEIRRPYFKAAFFGSLIALISIASGTLLFYRSWLLLLNKTFDAQNHLALIIENINEAVIGRNLDGKIISWDKRAENIFGYSELEVKGKTLAVVLPPDSLEDKSQVHQKIMTHDAIDSIEIECIRKNGALANITLLISPIKDIKNNLIGSSILARDVTGEKQTEAKLKLSQQELSNVNQQFELAMEGSSDGFWVWADISKNEEWWSPRYYQLLGYRDGEIEANFDSFKNLLHPDDTKPMETMLTQHLHNNTPFELEYRLKTKGGGYRWFRGRGQARENESDHSMKMAGSIQDIHLQKEAIETNNYLAAIIEDSPDAIIGKNIEGNIVSWNRGAEVLYGYKSDEAIGQNIHFIIPPDRKNESHEFLQNLENDTKIIAFKTKRICKDGTTIDVSLTVSPIKDKAGTVIGASTIARNITEDLKAQKELKENQEDLAEAQRIAQVGSWVWNIKNNSLRWSDEIYRLFGLSPQEFPANYPAFLERVHPEDRSMVEKSVEMSLANQKPYNIEHRITLPNGEIRHVNEQSFIKYDTDDQPHFMIGTVQEITRRKMVELELESYRLHLEELVEKRTNELQLSKNQLVHSEKLASIGKLVASFAHEFNNPLFGVITAIQEINDSVIMDDEHKELSDIAIRECKRMADLIKKLQDFNRPSSHKLEALDLHGASDEMLILISKTLKEKNIRLIKNYAPALPKVLAVEDQIKQVILNVLQNAEYACPETYGEIRVSSEFTQGQVTLHIRDNGCGISEANLEKIFEPFFTTKPSIKGTGLGLSVSHGIMQANGGVIKVNSIEGQGTTISLVFQNNIATKSQGGDSGYELNDKA